LRNHYREKSNRWSHTDRNRLVLFVSTPVTTSSETKAAKAPCAGARQPDASQGASSWGGVCERLWRASRMSFRFHGSSASIASTVVAAGRCSNTSLRYSKGSTPLAAAYSAQNEIQTCATHLNAASQRHGNHGHLGRLGTRTARNLACAGAGGAGHCTLCAPRAHPEHIGSGGADGDAHDPTRRRLAIRRGATEPRLRR
jgi:hypothetical protein